MYYLIYETTNLTNGKLYRGAHQTLKDGMAIIVNENKYAADRLVRGLKM